MKVAPPSQKTQSTNRSYALGSYLAITAGVAAVSLPNADAAVIAYDGPALTVTKGDTNNFLYFSPLATAGLPTLGIRAGISNASTLDSFNIIYSASDYVYSVKPTDNLLSMAWGVTSAGVYDVPLLKRNAGATIDATSNDWFTGDWAYMRKQPWTTAQSPWATNQDGTTGFVPFKFALNSEPTNIYYGWANYTYNNGATDSLTLNNFAYENTPNTAITTGVVPEPSTLLLLALGGAGVAGARRLRKEKKAANAPVA